MAVTVEVDGKNFNSNSGEFCADFCNICLLSDLRPFMFFVLIIMFVYCGLIET